MCEIPKGWWEVSEPIIIEIPSPTCRARFVLVHVGQCSGTTCGIPRDATPADLARGGYVLEEGANTIVEELGSRYRQAAETAERYLARAEKAERERDEAKAGHNAVQPRVYALEAELAGAKAEARSQGEDAARLCGLLATLRAELARLTAPGEGSEGEPTDEELLATANAAWAANMSTAADARRALFRAGVAHKRARQQPAKDRATDEARPLREVSAELEAMRTTHDERDRVYVGAIASDDELVTVYRRAAEPLGDEHGVSLRDLVRRCQARGVLAVAARVRQERCLVAQAVRMGCGVIISRTSERVPGTTGMWDVYVTRRPDVPGEHYAYGAPAVDVPSTLARLLGEVSRG